MVFMCIHYAHREDAMKTQNVYNQDAPKRPVNLSANADLLKLAKDASINLSQTFEEAVIAKVRICLEAQWLDENREAIAAYNARIQRDGVFGSSKRSF